MKKNILLFFAFFLLILTSTNILAQRWQKVTSIPPAYINNYWLDVFFSPSNPSYGWICGHNGMVLRTTDGGSSWSGVALGGNYQLESIHFPNDNVGFTAGIDNGPSGNNKGFIFKTTNGGQNWFNISPPSSSYSGLWGTYFLNANNGFVIGGGCNGKQTFFKTTDGGNSWSLFEANQPNSGLTDLIVYSMFGDGYASGSGWIWRTTDGGNSWANWSNTGASDWQEEITKVGNSFCVPTSGGCSGGSGGGIRFSTDNGNFWKQFNTFAPMYGTFLLTAETGWAAGLGGNVWYTSDGGDRWELRNCGFNGGDLDDIWFISSNNGWIVGAGVFKLAQPLQTADLTALNFGDMCMPGDKDSVIEIENINFKPDDVTLTILNDLYNEFEIINPGYNFVINTCETERIRVRYTPKKLGNSNAQLRIDFAYGTSLNVNLSGMGLLSTASPKDTLVIINPAYCGTQNVSDLKFLSQTSKESVASFTQVSGSSEIKPLTSLPYQIPITGGQIAFSANPIDTGWISARYFCDFIPCSKDTSFTVMAYGVSPIISSEQSHTVSLKCDIFGYDSIPVFNTGNGDLIITGNAIIESGTNFSIVGWDGGNKIPVVIPPGTSKSIIVRYDYRQGPGNKATIRMNNTDLTTARGNKNPFDLNIWGVKNTADFNIKEQELKFGKVCQGDDSTLYVFIKNIGDVEDSLIRPLDNSVFTVMFPDTSDIFKLKKGDSTRISIKFRPVVPGYQEDTLFICSFTCDDTIKLYVNGTGINAGIDLDTKLIKATLQTNVPYKTKIKIKSIGTEDILVDLFMVPKVNNILFEVNPTVPKTLTYMQNQEFELIFTMLTDTVFKDFVQVDWDGICDGGTNISLDLQSFSAKVEFELDTLNYGIFKCTTGFILDTLIMINNGLIEDTVVFFELTPSGVPFTILNFPDLPLSLMPNEKYPLYIEYAPLTEGVHSGTITMRTSAGKNLEKKVVLLGEFAKTETSLNNNSADFGDIESCDIPQEIHIWLKNTGTLKDSLTITRLNNHQGFTIVPNDFIIVPGKDSTEFVIFIDPALFQTLGKNNDRIIFKSEVCPGFDTMNISANIFHNKLSYNPTEINFGNVWIDNIVLKDFLIENKSGYPKNITGMEILNNNNLFKIEKKLNYPINFSPGDSLRIPVSFTALNEGHWEDNLRIVEESVCIDTFNIRLFADVPKEIYEATVKIDDYRVPPGSKLIMPVRMDLPIPNLNHSGLNYKISFDPRIFKPTAVLARNRNNIVETLLDYDYSNGVISGFLDSIKSDIILKNAGDVMWLQGVTLLAKPDSTIVNIELFDPVTSKTVTINKIDGSILLINYCIPIASFDLQFINNPKVYLLENPVENSELTLKYISEYSGYCSLSFYNTNGTEVFFNQITIPAGDNDINFDVSKLSSGVYYYLLKTDMGLIYRDRFIIYH